MTDWSEYMKNKITSAGAILCGAVSAMTILSQEADAADSTSVPQAAGVTSGYLSNFLKPEYFVPWTPVNGAEFAGDLDAKYGQLAIPVAPNREILIIGEYPVARYFSLILYDQHGAIIDELQDYEIEPLRPQDQNPYRPGGPVGAEDQLYAATIRLGDQMAGEPSEGCGFGELDVYANLLDARLSHSFYDRYSCQTRSFEAQVGTEGVVHDDNPENAGAVLMIRQYLPEAPGPDSKIDLRTPLVWVRNSASGCALPLAAPGTRLDPSQWYQGSDVSDPAQIFAHIQHEKDLGRVVPEGPDPLNGVQWFGSEEYILRSLVEGYVAGRLPEDKKAVDLNNEGRVLQLRFRMPEMPGPEACRACALNGGEELRYWSLSLVDTDNDTIATLSDVNVVTGGRGYATVIVTFGTPLPDYVNETNNYTVLDLSNPGGDPPDIKQMTLRNILPSGDFQCSTSNVPPRTHEYHSAGGYMGQYLPIVNFPLANELPELPFPPKLLTNHGGTCVNPNPLPDPCL
jgi:hypothetical protein